MRTAAIALGLAVAGVLVVPTARVRADAPDAEEPAAEPETTADPVVTEPVAGGTESQTSQDATEDERAEADDSRGEDVVASLGNVVGTDRGEASETLAPSHRINWRADWPRYSFDEALLSLGMGALLVAAELLPTRTTSANWTGGILFDQGVREGLALRSYEARESARVASEVLQWVLIGFPFVVDALAVTGIGDGNWDAAFQMGLISLESYVIALVIWKITALLARRERPVASACADGRDSPHCSDVIETTSFFSNQSMNAFTGASLMCLHHTHMPLFGDEAADVSTCVGGLTAAAVVGLLRVMSDFEYLTDVIGGALVGFFAGYVIPWFVHYQGGARPELRAPVAVIPVPMIAPDTLGLTVAGWF